MWDIGCAKVSRLFASAAYRLAFTYTAVCALAILLLGTGVYLAAGAAIQQQQDEDLRKEGDALFRAYQKGGRAYLLEALQRREASPNNDFVYALFDHGRKIAGKFEAGEPPRGLSNLTFIDPREGPDQARGLLTRLPDGTGLLVALDTEGLERLDATILLLFSIAFVLIVALGIAGSLALGRHLKQRLDRISTTATAIASGDLASRIEESGASDEFDRVDTALNAMLDRITSLLENLQQVSSDIAHDLRTPLTRLRAEIEAGLNRPDNARAMHEALQRALDQSDSVLSLFAAILRIAEVEGGTAASGFQRLDLSALTASVGEMYGPALEDQGRSLHCSADTGLAILGDRELVMQALGNLLDNALAHTSPGTDIHVTARRDAGGIHVAVADNGPGIAAADRERVVRRFVRLDASRSCIGHGLGLNLVAAVMKAHGGSLRLDDNRPGLVVTMTFPAAE